MLTHTLVELSLTADRPIRILTFLQDANAHPDLARAVAPAGLLSPAEQARCAAFRVEKRRRDWLLGRWTAKHLLRAYLAETTGVSPSLDALVIEPEPGGAPVAVFRDVPLPLSLSISHSGSLSFCALTDRPGVQIGADIELTWPNLAQMARQFFTADELAWVARAAPDSGAPEAHDQAIVAVWSAKEAVLKALRLGLSVDTRRITCLPQDIPEADGWRGVVVHCDKELFQGHLAAWWQPAVGHVRTLAVRLEMH